MRFTPTGVGNTSWQLFDWLPVSVHPHGRGEYMGIISCGFLQGGSPPRAWGIRMPSSAGHDIWRFTPTGVGNTVMEGESIGLLAVHPHGRGEYLTE